MKKRRVIVSILAFGMIAGAVLLAAVPLPEKLKMFDLDGDGKLSAKEFWDPALFAKIDTNRDGFATGTELVLHYLKNPPPKQPPAAKSAISPRSPEESFAYLDRDADGVLSFPELEQLHDVVPLFRDNVGMARVVFNQLDTNRDGALSPEEFRGVASLGKGKRPVIPKAATKAAEPETAMAPVTEPLQLKPEELAFFEKNIRPVLSDHCYKCHSAEADKLKGGLTLDTRAGLRAGGDSGPSIVAGDLDKSLLIEALRYTNSDLQMPPEKSGGKLPDSVIRSFEQWVNMGAPDPRSGTATTARATSIEQGRDYWAFKPFAKVVPPIVKEASWPRSDIDRFLLAEMEARGAKPVGDAARRDWLRRVSFDLIGLPPAPQEIAAFVTDAAPDAHAKVVDRLLASPQYGERWSRHWLDVARYADSTGRGSNILYPEAWRYRDYVIAAFNTDKPYDRFIREQLAGDLLPAASDAQRAEQIVATGFLTLGPKELAEKDRLQFQLDVVDEQLDTLGQAMLGLTLGCARCHDHKFDPIPQRDYYALAGIFRSTETCYGTVGVITNAHPASLVELPAGQPVVTTPQQTREKLLADRDRLDRELRALTGGSGLESYQPPAEAAKLRPFILTRSQLVIVTAKLRELDADGKPRPFAMAVRDKPNPADMPLYLRGEPAKPAKPVARGFLQVLPSGAPISAGSGRLELADWVASPENPLTARVMVNRVWHHLFGRGIVPSTDNFGAMGEPPSHPALLDTLAARFVERGWSVKTLIREIVLSRAYQLATTHRDDNYTLDPDNALVWRMSPRRLDAEAARDAMLAVSGKLDLKPPFASAPARVGNNFTGLVASYASREATSSMRSIYLAVLRDQPNEALAAFDAANANTVTGDREETTTPAQALFLMNSPIMQNYAEAWAKRLATLPTPAELRAAKSFFETFLTDTPNKTNAGSQAFVAFCQALLASAEFRTLN